jgi:hypothetical protein
MIFSCYFADGDINLVVIASLIDFLCQPVLRFIRDGTLGFGFISFQVAYAAMRATALLPVKLV